MPDERLRELERRWNESCSTEDESAFLLERVRAGYLPREMLKLAAILDHQAARLAFPQEELLYALPFRLWHNELSQFGREALVRTCLALATYCIKRFCTPRLLGRYQAARLWCLNPSRQLQVAALTTMTSSFCCSSEEQESWVEHLFFSTAAATASLRMQLTSHHTGLVLSFAHEIGTSTTYELVRAMLLPWALGESDPLLEDPVPEASIGGT